MPPGPPAPIIVTALLGAEDLAWAESLRRAHYPAERNQLPAHLTLFHHLPPSALDALARLLMGEARTAARPAARVSRLIGLGQGVALGVDSPGLVAIRGRIADAMHGQLMPQDLAGWRPHITIQNKVAPSAAQALLRVLRPEFRPRPIAIEGLAAWWYRGGPWEPIRQWKWSGAGLSRSGPSRRS
jgi:hypothetical protein